MTNIKITNTKIGVERRQQILDDITDKGTFLPKGVLEEDMDEDDMREILSQLQKIADLNKNEIKPLIEDLQMMLEEFKLTGSAIVTI